MSDIHPPSNSSSDASASVLFAGDDVDIHSCRLLGPIALTVQGLMGVLVILSLKPMRPWRIWLFDVSKQVAGQMFVHAFNVFVSDLVSHHSSNNACVSYFLNILIDTTLGVGLIYVLLRVFTYIASERFQLKGFESGIYGTPPSFKYWLRQATIYILALTTMKFMVIGLLALLPGLWSLGAWLLSWTWSGEGDSVMGIFPILMNILQFWLIDSIVKASGVALDLDSPDPLDREPLFRSPDDDDDDDDDAGSIGIHNPYSQTDIESHPHAARSLSPSSQLVPAHQTNSCRTPQGVQILHLLRARAPRYRSTCTRTHPASRHLRRCRRHRQPTPQAPVLREATKLKPKRRNPPSPITIRNNNRPAVNSPRPGPTPKSAPASAAPAPAPAPAAPKAEADAWGESWDDTDDWADKVGEEDWTGRRLEEKKNVLSDWDNGSPWLTRCMLLRHRTRKFGIVL
ncbi:vacuolar membrane protein-domain-containing protein [Mycena olivaceomarginata]|nr:vacuolar membrane protein-domain-containing protein [Mycena olivaceomarginata]